MRLRTLCAAAALVAFAAPPALASTGSTYLGGCGFDMRRTEPAVTTDYFSGGTYTGVMFFAVALLPADGDPHVVGADVSCEFWVNGVTVATLGPEHVTGAGASAGPFSVHLDRYDDYGVCEVVVYDDGTPPERQCPVATSICDPECSAYENIVPLAYPVEELLCALLGGDVHLAGRWLLDCRPYGAVA